MTIHNTKKSFLRYNMHVDYLFFEKLKASFKIWIKNKLKL